MGNTPAVCHRRQRTIAAPPVPTLVSHRDSCRSVNTIFRRLTSGLELPSLKLHEIRHTRTPLACSARGVPSTSSQDAWAQRPERGAEHLRRRHPGRRWAHRRHLQQGRVGSLKPSCQQVVSTSGMTYPRKDAQQVADLRVLGGACRA